MRQEDLHPSHLLAINNLAILRFRLGHLDDAQRLLENLIARHPRLYKTLNNLGTIAARRHDQSKARRRFRQALAINPNYLSARQNLARSERAIAKARHYLDTHRASVQSATLRKTLLAYARACYTVGNYPCAHRYLSRTKAPTTREALTPPKAAPAP